MHLESAMTTEEVTLVDVDYEKETTSVAGEEWGVDLFYLFRAPLL